MCPSESVGTGPVTRWHNFKFWELSAPFQVSRGRVWHLPEGLEEVASACLKSPRWQRWLVPAPRAPVGGVLLPGSSHRDRSSYGCPTPFLVHLLIVVSCISGRPRLLPSTHSVVTAWPLQAVSVPKPGPLPGTELQSLSCSTQPHPHWQRSLSGWGTQDGCANPLCRLFFVLASTNWLLFSPFRLQNSPSVQSNFSTGEEPSQGAGNFSPSHLPPQGTGPMLILSFSYSLCPTWLRGHFLVFSDIWGLLSVLSSCSVWIIALIDVFSMFLWRAVNSASYSSAILVASLSIHYWWTHWLFLSFGCCD